MPLRFYDPIPSKHTSLITIDSAAKNRDIQINERKVCIVLSGSRAAFDSKHTPLTSIYEDMVFVVDLKWESDDVSCDGIVTSMTLTVRFDSRHFFCAQFCVVGSTLYVFEGYDHWRKDNPAGGNSMYTYQLSDGISNLKLDKSMLSKGPPMNQVIFFPKVALTPDGKILVFSWNSTRHECGHEECVFELYDPVDGVWQKLPSLRPSHFYNRSVRDFDIEAFTFMKGGGMSSL